MVLDSDILIYFLKGNKNVVNEVLKHDLSDLYITRINCTELLYGAYNSTKIKGNLTKINAFLAQFTVLEFDEKSSKIFAQLKAKLKKEGNIIADMDLMIASITIANQEMLATNNHKHFERIKELKRVVWRLNG
ncbi:MAG: PIN domain-containing protein [Sulfurimonadaceae bacterium]|jgi:predicted nucleic acid-binding protein|nr:PIN domain-containing protein [Arcobacteraceae bacterium]